MYVCIYIYVQFPVKLTSIEGLGLPFKLTIRIIDRSWLITYQIEVDQYWGFKVAVQIDPCRIKWIGVD